MENIIQNYKNQFEEVSATVALLQQHVTNLKNKNSHLQEKTRKDRHDLDRYCEENKHFDRRLCLSIENIENIEKQRNQSSKKVLKAVKWLLSEGSINVPDAYIERAHHVSRTGKIMLVRIAIFRPRAIF